ncbi:MAG: hypothetical protein GF333_02985 [Candidatus Omnitrophica bacterium]|nr:hypothetical protein [Candidatus Omnitrophota bacterium]
MKRGHPYWKDWHRVRPLMLVTAMILFGALAVQARPLGRVVARINEEIITSKDLYDYCMLLNYQQGKRPDEAQCGSSAHLEEVMEKLIEDKLILHRAKQENFRIPDYAVEEKIDEIISSYESRAAFERSLVEKGLTITLLKKKIRDQFLVRRALGKYVESRVSVAPQEISRFYQRYSSRFDSPETYVFWIAKSDRRSFLERIAEEFADRGAETAKNTYQETLIKIESSRDELRNDIYEVIAEMDPGGYRIKNIDGQLHFVYLEKIIPAKSLSLDQVKEDIYSFLYEQEFAEQFQEWVTTLKENAVIVVY